MRAISSLILMMLIGCAPPGGAPAKMVRYAFKNFTENRILAEMYSLLLIAGGYTTTHGNALNSSETRNGLLNNDLDIYPEYTGTGLALHLGVTDKSITTSPTNINDVRALDLQKNLIAWGDAANFNNSFAIAVSQSDPTGAGFKTLSDLAGYVNGHPGDYKWIVNKEFYERPDGLFGMLAAYGITLNSADIIRVNETDLSGSVYGYYQTVMGNGVRYAVLVFSTDSQLVAFGLNALTDDKRFFPYYAPAANVRKDFLDRYPDILMRVNPIAPLLTATIMAGLNHQVDYDMLTPEQTAHDFLVRNGLLAQ